MDQPSVFELLQQHLPSILIDLINISASMEQLIVCVCVCVCDREREAFRAPLLDPQADKTQESVFLTSADRRLKQIISGDH